MVLNDVRQGECQDRRAGNVERAMTPWRTMSTSGCIQTTSMYVFPAFISHISPFDAFCKDKRDGSGTDKKPRLDREEGRVPWSPRRADQRYPKEYTSG